MPDHYSDKYMKSHCIDVFFRYQDLPIHVLTYGSILPPTLNDLERNRKEQQRQARQIEEQVGQVNIQPEEAFISYMRQDAENVGYEFNRSEVVEWFISYARAGFYTYDCISCDDSQATFKLVAIPSENTNALDELSAYEDIEVLHFVDGGSIPETFVWRYNRYPMNE